MEKDPYTRGLKTEYGSMMTAFPDLSEVEIDAIMSYINDYTIRAYVQPDLPWFQLP